MITKMFRLCWLVFMIFLFFCCNEEKTKISEVKIIKPNKLKKYFKLKKIPYTIKSNQFKNEIDSQKISPELIKQIIPEKFILLYPEFIQQKNNIYPLFYFDNSNDEWYLLLLLEMKDRYKIFVCYFDENNKIKSVGYIDYFSKKLVNEPIQITITKEPTFISKGMHSTQDKMSTSYSKSFDFIEDSFCIIVEEYMSKEDVKNLDTTQKINLNATKNFYCGEYFFKNNKLILSDGENNFSYSFLLQSLLKDKCPLEMSGTFNLKKNKGEFQIPNTTCQLIFSVSNNLISVREAGNCRDKKDYECNFSGTYSLHKINRKSARTKIAPPKIAPPKIVLPKTVPLKNTKQKIEQSSATNSKVKPSTPKKIVPKKSQNSNPQKMLNNSKAKIKKTDKIKKTPTKSEKKSKTKAILPPKKAPKKH